MLAPRFSLKKRGLLSSNLSAGVGDSVSAWTPLNLFAGGVVGGWYDPSDISTLWQDSARTTPVTTSGQPVGAIDDKSGNGRHLLQATAANRGTYAAGDPATFGSDLVSNGTFASDTVWAKGAGWAIAAGVASATTSTASLSQAVTVTAGKLYQLVFTLTRSAGSCTPRITGGTTTNGLAQSANGTYTIYLRAETGNTTLEFFGSSSFTGTIDNVTLKEVLTYSGYAHIRLDGVDDAYAESGTHTLALPCYLAAIYSKEVEDANGILASNLNSTNLAQIANSATSTRAASSLRSTARGTLTVNGTAAAWPVATIAVIDSLHVDGTSDVQVNNSTLTSSANTWSGAGDNVALAKLRIAQASGTAATAGKFYGGLVLVASNPGATNRAKVKTFLGAKVGLTL